MNQVEKSFKYLEATYDSLVLPGDKRTCKAKMETSRKEYTELRSAFLRDEQALDTQKNKEQLAYTTTAGGANYKAQQDVRQKLLGDEEKLYDQDDQLERIK